MQRKEVIGISLVLITLLVASFSIGSLYLPSEQFIDRRYTPASSSQKTMDMGSDEYLVESNVEQERMIIYNAYVSLETDDIDSTLIQIKNLVENYGGYVAGSSRSTYDLRARAEIVVRIPKEKFHDAISEIESYGKLLDERTTSEDITEQYIDLRARLDNFLRQETRLDEILNMSKTVDEILKVEKELTRIRGEIESLQGQINYLERNVEMSLIVVTLYEPSPPFTSVGMKWIEVLETAVMSLFAVISGLIILIVSLSPVIIIGTIVYYVLKRRKPKVKRRRK